MNGIKKRSKLKMIVTAWDYVQVKIGRVLQWRWPGNPDAGGIANTKKTIDIQLATKALGLLAFFLVDPVLTKEGSFGHTKEVTKKKDRASNESPH